VENERRILLAIVQYPARIVSENSAASHGRCRRGTVGRGGDVTRLPAGYTHLQHGIGITEVHDSCWMRGCWTGRAASSSDLASLDARRRRGVPPASSLLATHPRSIYRPSSRLVDAIKIALNFPRGDVALTSFAMGLFPGCDKPEGGTAPPARRSLTLRGR